MVANTGVKFRGLDHIGLTVADLDAAVQFYTDAFGGEVLYHMGPFDAREMPAMDSGADWTEAHINVKDAALRFVGIRIADTLQLELYEFARPQGAEKPPHSYDVGGHHFALRVDDLDKAGAHLTAKGCRMMEGVIAPPDGPLLGSRSHYFQDPFGHTFELMEYDRMAFMDEAR
jgi:catechol 2,3-dioxygenase-like lactoylglutathione lyase family enzyme